MLANSAGRPYSSVTRPLVAALGLLDALHGDDAVGGHGHGDGVEAYELAYGGGYRLVLHVCADAEVLKVVVDEVDCVAVCLVAEQAQGLGHGHVVEVVAHALGLHRRGD